MLNNAPTNTSMYFGPCTRTRKRTALQENVSPTSLEKEIKIEPGLIVKTEPNQSLSGKVAKKAKQVKTEKKIRPKLEIGFEPPHWQTQFDNIRQMRKKKDAPVDKMGCERCTEDKYTEKVGKLCTFCILPYLSL